MTYQEAMEDLNRAAYAAVANTYVDGISIDDWQAAALARVA